MDCSHLCGGEKISRSLRVMFHKRKIFRQLVERAFNGAVSKSQRWDYLRMVFCSRSIIEKRRSGKLLLLSCPIPSNPAKMLDCVACLSHAHRWRKASTLKRCAEEDTRGLFCRAYEVDTRTVKVIPTIHYLWNQWPRLVEDGRPSCLSLVSTTRGVYRIRARVPIERT